MTKKQLDLIADFSRFLQKWAAETEAIGETQQVVLQQLDTTIPDHSISDFFCVTGASYVTDLMAQPIKMANQDILDTNSLRNSFFPEIFRKHSGVRNLTLQLRGQGRFHLSICCSTNDGGEQVLIEKMSVPESEITTVDFPDIKKLPKNSRLWVRVQALSAQAELQGVSWLTRAPRASRGRMVVLLRTFGRTKDIKYLFQTLNAEAGRNDFKHCLANTAFVILDTSDEVCPEDYAEFAKFEAFNIFVLKGVNLGGGGNMSQVKLLLHKAMRSGDVAVDEVLLLDDDLTVSLESLRRNWAASLFRSDCSIFTLPVFTKSKPRVLWEDGSFWGRFVGDSVSGKRELVQPVLLRHNLRFEGSANLDHLAEPHYPEYATFIFQSMPFSVSEELGYPAAFFLRGDDIEYSLRARALGYAVLSNPNLCSWHEPAHSYGQEYMSISHGVIVNLCHGQNTPDTLVQFFHQRALDHLEIADPFGLELYGCALMHINRCKSFLESGFVNHYIEMLYYFRNFDSKYESLPSEIVDAVIGHAKATGGRVARYPFLYKPDLETDMGGKEQPVVPLTKVILDNPHTGQQYLYSPQDPDHLKLVVKNAATLYRELAQFSESFEQIKEHYKARMKITSTAEFWNEELSRHDNMLAPLQACLDDT